MTRKQFEQLAKEIRKQKFESVSANPLVYAAQRADFRQKQLLKLIDAGRKVKDSSTVRTKIQRYERLVAKFSKVPARVEALMKAERPKMSF